MTLRNFDSSTSKFIASLKKRDRVRMILMTLVVALFSWVAFMFKPPGVELNVRFFLCLSAYVAAVHAFGKLLSMIKEYLSQDRKRLEDEIASRMIYLRNMTTKGMPLNKESPDKIQ